MPDTLNHAALARVAEWRDVDLETFRRDIEPRRQPAILRGLVGDWPLARAAAEGPKAMAEYLVGRQNGRPIKTLYAPPEAEGRFFYNSDMQGFNFVRRDEPFANAMARLVRAVDDPNPPAIYVQSTPVSEYFPALLQELDLPLAGAAPDVRIWIGNRITVRTHYDLQDNVACAVMGPRRFMLFPPDQFANLYVGPFDLTPSGAPVSMVQVDAPDFERFPRFREALAHAQIAELEPGDAIFIPYAWWHNVESLGAFNVLVNYWWNQAQPQYGSPYDALLHCVLVMRDMAPSHRAAWRAMFDEIVFETNGESQAHLRPEHRSLLGPMTPEKAKMIRTILQQAFK